MKIENNKAGTTQNRFKSKYTWAALLSVVMFILGHYGLYDRLGIDSTWLQTLFDLVWVALSALGIVNNGTDSKNW